MCVFLYDVKVNPNRGIRLKTGMSFFIRPLYSYVMLMFCVGVKKNDQKILHKSG